MFKFKPIRWGGHESDKYFGPITFSYSKTYKPFGIILSSGKDDDDDFSSCNLRISLMGYTFITTLPSIIQPWKEKVVVTSWDIETINRMGGNFYYTKEAREYGFSYSEGYLSIDFGRQSHNSSTEQQWGMFLPWTEWRFIRVSYYDLGGQLFGTVMVKKYRDTKIGEMPSFNQQRAMKELCPSKSFSFLDYDGKRISARTHIEEREWRFGEGSFKWLSWFRQPKIVRSLEIVFSNETGRRKGSWKGGTIGHSIQMKEGELHEDAFQRYCSEHEMHFELPLIPSIKSV